MAELTNIGTGVNGFGAASERDIMALAKALEAGTAVVNQTGGSALRVEALDASLKVTQWGAHHIKLWKRIPKSPAYSTVEEYNELSDYGGYAFPFTGEGELPQATDSTYRRNTAFVKFLGTVREITHQMTLAQTSNGDAIALENHNGILWLLERIEHFLFKGDSSLAFDGEAEQWNGLDALIDSTMVIDMEGASLQEADIEEAAELIVNNYGYPSDIFLGTRAYSDLNKTFYPRERVALPAPVNGQVGLAVGSVMTMGGPVNLVPDVFVREAPSPRATATSVQAPATPASISAGAATGTTGDHNKGAPAGSTYLAYMVTACNKYGESAPTAASTAVVQTQSNKDAGTYLPLTITNPAVIGAYAPEYFRIYRCRAQASATAPTALASYSLIAQVPASSQAAGGTTTYNDLNLYLPFTSIAYMGELGQQVLTFRQLLPMMKMDLAILSPAYRWMILLYGTPVMFQKKKWMRFINVGKMEARR